MPKFVVLQHEMPARSTHWDFMLEAGGALRTWALNAEPAADEAIEARALADHRLEYLTYEGPISGDRGSVTQWDAGEFELLRNSEDETAVKLVGRKLQGTAVLQRDTGDAQRWIFRFSG